LILLSIVILIGSVFIAYKYIYVDYMCKETVANKPNSNSIGKSSLETKEALININNSIESLQSVDARIKNIVDRSNELKMDLENEVERLNKADALLQEIRKQRDSNKKLIKDIRVEIGGERESKLKDVINYFMVFLIIALTVMTEKLRKGLKAKQDPFPKVPGSEVTSRETDPK